ncbi:TonB-dependent receptor [Sphingomonas oryzagri]|uniref:TonB-dependent receptor n=1 Tax=Sphingomonas oryzagri TaxID=3042314 RepID=A0ABT6MXN6_9SPHN|nr:TonB-dependent receptor [Sphingomonas oryzagri]MDH7637677.1 TonB-dependent receptor [Sphingomonas oryzagri]
MLAGTARAGAPRTQLDLPAGPLSKALAALAAQDGTSVGVAEAGLLKTQLPPLHLEGSADGKLRQIIRTAHLTGARLGPGLWRIERPLPGRNQAPAAPQSPVPAGEIVVRASKQDEPLAKYPAEVFVVDAVGLDRYTRAPDTQALTAQVPILLSTDWGGGRDKLFLRGIADSSFTGSSPALVGQYFGDQRLTYSAPDPDLRLYDVADVEVLAGPQGTLYGAGSLGGIIRVEPNAPQLGRVAGAVWLGLSDTAHGAVGGDAGAMINFPLVGDRLALRAVGYMATDAGYIDDVERGLKNINRSLTHGGRLSLRWKLSDRWTLDTNGIAQRIDNRDAPFETAGDPVLTRSSLFPQPSYNLFLSGNVVVTGKIGTLSVHSTTGFVDQSLGERFEVLLPAKSINLFDEKEHADLISQETRVSASSPLADWVLGASFLQTNEHESRSYGRPAYVAPLAQLHQRTSEANIYAQATRRLIGALSVTLGGRFDLDHLSGETINVSSPFQVLTEDSPLQVTRDKRQRATSDEHRFAPSVALSYTPLLGLLTFLRYEAGFRPGGLTLGMDAQHYAGDRLGAAELGLRYGVAGKDGLAFSLTGTESRWRDIQADILDGIGEPAVANIGNGHVATIDATLDLRIMPEIQLHAAGFLARSRLHSPGVLIDDDYTTVLPNVARNGASVTLDYAHDDAEGWGWRGGIRVQHVGPSILGIETLRTGRQGDYTTAALDAGLTVRRIAFTIDVTNLFGSRAPAFDVGTPFASFIEHDITPLRPRTVRLGMHYSF